MQAIRMQKLANGIFAINNIIYYFVEIATVLRTLAEKIFKFFEKG